MYVPDRAYEIVWDALDHVSTKEIRRRVESMREFLNLAGGTKHEIMSDPMFEKYSYDTGARLSPVWQAVRGRFSPIPVWREGVVR